MAKLPQQKRGVERLVQLRRDTPEPATVTTPRQGQIQLQQHPHKLGNGRLFLCDQATEFSQHLALFITNAGLKIHQPVADGQHRSGLYEQRAAGG